MLKKLIFTAGLLTTLTTHAELVRLNISGTIERLSGNVSNNQSTFEVGDSVVYQVDIEEGNFGNDSFSSLNNIGDFRARVGSYNIRGNGGITFTRNNGTTPVFEDPYDQLTISHSNLIRNNAIGAPGRNDFTQTDGPIEGIPLTAFELVFQNPDVNFVNDGETIEEIVSNIISNFDAINQNTMTDNRDNTVLFSADFLPGAFGGVELGVSIDIDSISIDSTIVETPLAYGTAAAAIVRNQRFGNAVDTYNTTSDNEGGLDSFANAFSTSSGTATARAEITNAVIENGELVEPGLEVGAFSSGAGEGYTSSRGIAFRSFEYLGDGPTSININSILDGRFGKASFGLPQGTLSASGGIYVFDALELTDAINFLGGDLDDIFFPLRNKNTDSVSANALNSHSITNLLGINALSSLEFSKPVNFDTPVDEILSLALDLNSGREFSVLYDISTTSNVARSGNKIGAGSVNFFNSLKADTSAFFTDTNGNTIQTIRAIEPANPGVTQVPEPPMLLLFLTALYWSISKRRRCWKAC